MKASRFLLSKPKLFNSSKEVTILMGLFCVLLFVSLLSEFKHYQKLTQFNDYTTQALVKRQYKKENRWILSLQSTDGFSFYTTSSDELRPLEGYVLDVRLFTKDISFLSFLKGFYVPSVLLARSVSKENRYKYMSELESLHEQPSSDVFKALFFAGSINKDLRSKLSALGINHLLAISGFHLGVLSFILFFILKIIYKPIQGRLFPYRHGHRDIAIAVLVILFSYVYFLDFVPSLLRAFAMSAFAYVLYDRGIKILSFTSLFLVILFLMALWPRLVFSLGFWFSVAGVYYIFLFLHHMKELRAWQSFILLHVWVYLCMLPVVHIYFGTFSLYQLFSPLLTMLFIIFYPLELLLHAIGEGNRLDFILVYLLDIELKSIEILLPLWSLFAYIFISLLAIKHKFFFYLILVFTLFLLGYLLYGIT